MRRVSLIRRGVSLLAIAVTLSGAALITAPYAHGVSFVIRAADLQGTPRRLADLDTRAVEQREIAIPTPRGSLRARVYTPTSPNRRVALLTSGLHVSGIDEPRLTRLAHELAASGMVVVTPDIPELSRFEISPAITDTIERAAVWLATESGLDGDQRIGMMGISFSGGLSLVAAGRPSLKDHVNYVFSFGGHADLPRVLRYLCTGIEPMPSGRVRLKADATYGGDTTKASERGVRLQPDQPFVRPPHDYGVAVMLLALADRLVPAAQVAPLREAIRRYLTASALDSNVDKDKAAREFDALKLLAKTMREPSATLLRYINERDVVHLGARLLPLVGSYGSDPALSESRSPKPAAPVFLLHGVDDNVIPSIESEYLADDLRPKVPVRLLLSGLISHAEADRPMHVNDILQLASFWGDLLSR
jgi:dienelactone hydrolase